MFVADSSYLKLVLSKSWYRHIDFKLFMMIVRWEQFIKPTNSTENHNHFKHDFFDSLLDVIIFWEY